MQGVDFVITSFMRHDCVRRLVESIRVFYPDANIYVADQSQEPIVIEGVTVFQMPFDCGLSACRNHLFENTPSPWKLLLDDDFVFTPQTRVGALLDVAESSGADIILGSLYENGHIRHYEWNLQRVGDDLRYNIINTPWFLSDGGWPYRIVGMGLNFGLFRKDRCRWDPDLKTAEHTDFFLRFDGTVAYCPDAIVTHAPVRTAEYRDMRYRPDFFVMFMRKHSLKSVIRDDIIHYIKDDRVTTRHILTG